MAQSDSCPNPDLSNGAIVHSPVVICSDLDTQRGREDEEGEEEDEEVELAEEVGEDVLMMAGAEEGQAEGENREQNESEEGRIIHGALLPNRVICEENGGGEKLKKNGDEGVEVGDKEHKIIDEETKEKEGESTGQEESNDTNTVIENPCHFSVMIEVEKGQEQLLDNNEENEEDREDKENKLDVLASSETKLGEDKTSDRDNELEEHQMSSTDYADHVQDSGTLVQESGEGAQLSIDETDKTEVVPTDGEITERVEHPIIDVTPDTMEINEPFDNKDHVCQTSTVSDNSIPFDTTGTMEVVVNQTNQLTNENEYEMKNTDEKDNSESSKQEVESVDNYTTWQQKDCIEAKVEDEGAKEFLEDAMSASDDALEIGSEAIQKAEQPELAFVSSEEQSETEGGIEETRTAGINQKLEEEQVRQVCNNTLTVTDQGGQNTEEGGETGDNVVGEPLCEEEHGDGDYLKIQEEKIVQVENEAQVDLPEPDLQCVDEVPLDIQQDVDLDQVEQAFELEEESEAEPDKPGAEENESTAEEGGDLQEHPFQIFKEAVTDWEEKLREQLRGQALAEDRKGGGAEEEAMAGVMEMVEEPVTVLDDEIEEIEETQSTECDEQKSASITAHSEDTVETKAEEHQELQRENTELGKENDEIQKDGKGEVEKDEQPKDDNREVEFDINERVKGLKQAMENGILSPEPQPLSKEELNSARLLSARRRDVDWIKKDQPEEERAPEVKDWRKELKPVKKDIWESERGRKETLSDKKSPPGKEDWIKELKSVIKDESLPKKRDEQMKKKRVVLLEDGHSYFPRREEMNEKREEVKLISHRKVESPLSPVQRDSRAPLDQDYEISLYVKVIN